jgi:hypothetical protein
LVSYKEKLQKYQITTTEEIAENEKKKEFLQYIKRVGTYFYREEAAYIYTENTITYVVCFDGKNQPQT